MTPSPAKCYCWFRGNHLLVTKICVAIYFIGYTTIQVDLMSQLYHDNGPSNFAFITLFESAIRWLFSYWFSVRKASLRLGVLRRLDESSYEFQAGGIQIGLILTINRKLKLSETSVVYGYFLRSTVIQHRGKIFLKPSILCLSYSFRRIQKWKMISKHPLKAISSTLCSVLTTVHRGSSMKSGAWRP